MGKKVNYFDFRFRKSLRYEKRHTWDSLVAQMVKSLPTIWETWVQSLGHKNSLRRKCQRTPVFLPGKLMDGGTWQATVHAVTKSQTWLRDFTYV